jgi:hypothetical protein
MIKIRVSASCSTEWFRQNVVTRESMAEVWVLERRRTARQTPRRGQATAEVTRDCRNSRSTLLLSVCTAFSIALLYPSLNIKNAIRRNNQRGLSAHFASTFLNFCIQGVILFVDIQSDRDLT